MTTEYLSLEQLLAKRAETESGMPEDDVPVEGMGVVRVRGLSRAEVVELRGVDGLAAYERKLLSLAMVLPQMDEAGAGRWQAASPAGGEIEAVTDRISELSGMAPKSAKDVVREFVENPEAEFRDVPGPGAVDDAAAAAAGDVTG